MSCLYLLSRFGELNNHKPLCLAQIQEGINLASLSGLVLVHGCHEGLLDSMGAVGCTLGYYCGLSD